MIYYSFQDKYHAGIISEFSEFAATDLAIIRITIVIGMTTAFANNISGVPA